jgi:hypothetical protein
MARGYKHRLLLIALNLNGILSELKGIGGDRQMTKSIIFNAWEVV